MRTIKFRGKRVDNGEWVVGDLLQVANEVFIAPSDGDWFDFIPWTKNNVFHLPSATYEVIPDTVGQFTGLLDDHGEEIYEGDVVDFVAYDAIGNERGKEQGVVRFAFCGYQIGGYDMWNVLLNDDEAEVIGNIHDNPELLNPND